MAAQFNLQTLLTANISNLTTQLNRANQQIGQFQRNNQATGGNIQSIFNGASKAIGVAAGAFIAVKGAAASFEKVIESNQFTSDTFAVTMAELNSTVDYFAASLGQMDFTNFFQNLRLSNEAAKQLAETLDLLGDINRADAITTAKEEVRLAELENTYVNKRLDKQTRLNALTEATKIKQDAVNRELGKQNTELEATLNTITKLPSYMNKFGNDTKPALELVSQYGTMWRSGVHDKASEYNSLKEDANKKHVITTTATSNFGAYSVSTPDKKADEEAKKKYNDYIAALGADVGTVVNWAGLLESVQQNDASLDKLTALLVKGESLNGELAKIQVENTRTTNKILGKGEDGEDEKAIKAVETRISKEKELQIEKLKTLGIGNDPFNPLALDKNIFAPKAKSKQAVIPLEFEKLDAYSNKMYQLGTYQQAVLDSGIDGWKAIGDNITNTQFLTESFGGAINGLTDAFSGLFQGTEDGFKNVVTSMLSGVQSIINALLAQAVAGMIAGESKKGIVGLITGAVGVAALIGLWKTQVPAFETGGIIGGSNFSGDKVLARVNSGEMILNKGQQANLFGMLNSGSGGASAGEVVFRIDGNTLVGVLNNHNKRMTNFK